MPRPKEPLITRERIMRAALKIVDEDGPQALSTNRIAAALGVKGPSLYNHISGRSEVIEGLRELLVADIDLSAITLRPWTTACEQLARSMHASFGAHPAVVPLLVAQPIRSPAVLDVYELLFSALREVGWPESELFPLVRAIEYVVVGSLLDQAVTSPQESERAFDLGLRALVRGLEHLLSEHTATVLSADPREVRRA